MHLFTLNEKPEPSYYFCLPSVLESQSAQIIKKTLHRPSGGPSLPTGNKRTPCRSKRYENQNAINGLKTETYYVTLAKNQKFIKIVKPNFIHWAYCTSILLWPQIKVTISTGLFPIKITAKNFMVHSAWKLLPCMLQGTRFWGYEEFFHNFSITGFSGLVQYESSLRIV